MNITITGNLGSGKSSVAKILKEKGYEYSSTGNIFRQLAMEKGMSVEAFNKQVNEAAGRGAIRLAPCVAFCIQKFQDFYHYGY